jgi:hypothetical protein
MERPLKQQSMDFDDFMASDRDAHQKMWRKAGDTDFDIVMRLGFPWIQRIPGDDIEREKMFLTECFKDHSWKGALVLTTHFAKADCVSMYPGPLTLENFEELMKYVEDGSTLRFVSSSMLRKSNVVEVAAKLANSSCSNIIIK